LFKSPYNSFPAGHADAAMAISTVLAKNTDSYILKVVAYIPAALCLVQRVYSDNHWSSDVVISSALGYFVANWVVNLHDQKESRVSVTSLYPLGLTVSLDKIK
jgi:membrane-associated phospholipid phosphatase